MVKEDKKKKHKEEEKECTCHEENCCSDNKCECGCLEGGECSCSDSSCECEKDKAELEKQLEEALKEKESYKEKLIYKEAELINYRKRKDEEVSGIIKYASMDLILEIIKSIDNLERALNSVEENDNNKALLSGVKMVYSELVNTLKNDGVEEIESLNVKFDHNLHNAVMTDNNKDIEDDIITEVLQKGYKYKDKVIRPAMVKVNKIN